MEIVVCDPCQKFIQAEASWQHWLHHKLTVLGTQADFSTSTKANLLSQATWNPHTEAIPPISGPASAWQLNGYTTIIPAFG
jgi:hypothetical protein